MNIEKVKIKSNGYIINDSTFVPINPDLKEYKDILIWIENGGSVDPEFTVPEAIDKKLQELDNYHYNSTEIRQCKINNYFILQLDSTGRSLIQEQVSLLEQKIELGTLTEETAFFEYYYNGGSIQITLLQLRKIYVAMLDIVNRNFQNYKEEINIIKNLANLQLVEDHNFKTNYLKNQNITI